MALTPEELAGTTAGKRGKKSGGSEERAELAQGRGNRKGRRVMRCGGWIRLGDIAEEVVEEARHTCEPKNASTGRR